MTEIEKIRKHALEGKVAIVTGAGRGIGKAIALLFAKEGASVAITSRTDSEIQAVAEEIKQLGGQAIALRADVSKEEDVNKLVQTVLGKFGKVDILVNNAGVLPERSRGPVLETYVEDFDYMYRINLKGVFLCTKAVLKNMKERRQGYIINISSMAGKRVLNGHICAYRASKFGVMGFTMTLAKDVKDDGVNVSLICPGRVDTSMLPDSFREKSDPTSWLTPNDVAEVALFLATRSSKVIIPEIMIHPRFQVY